MTRLLFYAIAALLAATPAHATGGLLCRTAGIRPIEITLGFGHVAGTPLISTRLTDNGRQVPVTAPQWWFDRDEMRLLLVSPQGARQEGLLRARRNGRVYDGSLWRGGQRRWVRCREA